MKIFRGVPAVSQRRPTALTIGNFDGVHRGHQALLARVAAAATSRQLVPAVMSFEPHPREFFAPDRAPARISTLRDKLAGLHAAGMAQALVIHFNARFAALSPEQFVEQVLVEGCRIRWLLVGDDFRFGARRAGDIDLLRAAAARFGFEVEAMPTVHEASGERISSSAVRAALQAGELARAEALLGRPYAISGRVLHGRKLGRELGFPTLNLRLPGAHPAVHGIFAVRVHGLGKRARDGVASVGLRPTVEDGGRWLLEVHVFDFAAAVYGRLVRVEFVARLRDEARYDGLDALRAAIAADAAAARSVLAAR